MKSMFLSNLLLVALVTQVYAIPDKCSTSPADESCHAERGDENLLMQMKLKARTAKEARGGGRNHWSNCGFESRKGGTYCGLWDDVGSGHEGGTHGDIFGWTRISGPSKTGWSKGRTGPLKAASGKWYIYSRSRDTTPWNRGQGYGKKNRKKGDHAILRAENLKPRAGAYLEFQYSMFGKHIGTLEVIVWTGAGKDVMWTKTRQQIPDSSCLQCWLTARVNFDRYADKILKIEFKTTLSTQKNGAYGDIAIDDVKLQNFARAKPGSATEAPPMTKAPTESPTTQAPTQAPTTQRPTTEAPTTQTPTTKAPATKAPTDAPTETPEEKGCTWEQSTNSKGYFKKYGKIKEMSTNSADMCKEECCNLGGDCKAFTWKTSGKCILMQWVNVGKGFVTRDNHESNVKGVPKITKGPTAAPTTTEAPAPPPPPVPKTGCHWQDGSDRKGYYKKYGKLREMSTDSSTVCKEECCASGGACKAFTWKSSNKKCVLMRSVKLSKGFVNKDNHASNMKV